MAILETIVSDWGLGPFKDWYELEYVNNHHSSRIIVDNETTVEDPETSTDPSPDQA